MDGAMDRLATFRTVVAMISPGGQTKYFVGEVRGRVLEAPRCEPKKGMPYSPIFVPEGQELSLAEMSTEMKNGYSHRGKAFRAVRDYLEKKVLSRIKP
jgi:XTP/dITP diphosphohydrolase